MSEPLWLMMGTAFRISTNASDSAPPARKEMAFFLTAKHTFAPWDFVKDPTQMKIPDEYRKLRYVISRMYAVDEATQRAVPGRRIPVQLVATHPTLDVALLCTVQSKLGVLVSYEETAALSSILSASPLNLATSSLVHGDHAVIDGFRGIGVLGELDTLDATLLEKLSPQKRDDLLRELKTVEGKQIAAHVSVEVLDGKGMCRGADDCSMCYHGMSGGPIIANSACAGVLYGKHPDFPANIGYTPCYSFNEWLHDVLARR